MITMLFAVNIPATDFKEVIKISGWKDRMFTNN